MARSECTVTTDSRGRELVVHGEVKFPIACYDEEYTRNLVPWHWHEELEVLIITKGLAHVLVENQSISVPAGSAVLINSGMLHSINAGNPEEACGHSMVFHPRLIGGSPDSVFWQKLIRPVTENPGLRWILFGSEKAWEAEVVTLLEAAWQAVVGDEPYFEVETRTHLSRALVCLAKQLPGQRNAGSAKETRDADRTKIMMQYIHEHYAEELSLAQIAASAAVSESVCLRSFRHVIGISPIRYVMQHRVEQAARRLAETGEKVGEIAMMCGFSDISYFTKCFREQKGEAPLEYRKNHR